MRQPRRLSRTCNRDSFIARWAWLAVGLGLVAGFTVFPPSVQGKDHYASTLGVLKAVPPMKAPEFTLPDSEGNQVALKDFRGSVVFLNLWASWCPACRAEMPSMERLYQKLKDYGFTILAVNLKENPSTVRAFMEQFRLTFPALLDRRGKVASLYGLWSIPMTVLIDPDGNIVGRAIGGRNWSSQDGCRYIGSLLAHSKLAKAEVEC